MYGNSYGGFDFDGVPRSVLRGLGSMGRGYLSRNFDSQFPSLSADRAQEFQTAIGEAQAAMDAPYGSLAYRNNPFRYGSLASRKFPEIFGKEGRRQFEATQRQREGMTRRPMFGAYEDGNGF